MTPARRPIPLLSRLVEADRAEPTRLGFAAGVAILALVAVAKAVLADSLDPDFFWHVRVAEQLLSDGIGPVPDRWSFSSAPGDWTPFSWLGELLMKWTFDSLGLPGVVGGHALCSALFLALVAACALEATRQTNGSPRYFNALVATFVAGLFSLPFLSFRPVTFALVVLAAMTLLVWRDRRAAAGGRLVWLVVPLTLVLTNLHLYVILWLAGLVAITAGAFVATLANDPPSPLHRARAMKLLRLTIACAVAACGTPMLPGCVRNAIWFSRVDPMVSHALVVEIGPFYAGPLGSALLAVVIATLAFAFRRRRDLGWENLFWLAGATAILFQMGRFATVFAIFACPILAAAMPRLDDVALARPLVRRIAWAVVAMALVRLAVEFPRAGASVDAWLVRHGEDADDGLRYPTTAARWVESNVRPVRGRVLNELTWGGYLIWRLGDRFRVFADGRTLVYAPEFWERLYLDGDAARATLIRESAADVAIVPVRGGLLRDSLLSMGWTPAHRDARAIVLLPPGEAVANVDP